MQKQKSPRVFFFYPISFSPRSHSISASRFVITLKTFRRDLYRPITGKERLFGQTSLGPSVQIKFEIPSEFLASSNVETCRRHVSLVLANVEPRIREILVLYGIQLIGESRGRPFELKADAEDVEYHLMEESKGWTTSTCIPKSTTTPVEECTICLEDLCDDEKTVVAHDCCHVFHKLCLWRWIWTKSTCPLCRHPIYSRPEFLGS
ncbi:PREDICTED: putative RING-H2 finger protein ATL35 [Camelina sativa]|uniref:RING-H2 finger protein ATL35 n=1 Tax=Camelina sativa TaxID=90675 RepID=A0ABM0TAW1_CAMSA|nr:PREDICTED: putative RING-H2 finger protein ATL35 [Camelina sativa]